MRAKDRRRFLAEENPNAVLWEGHDRALVGVGLRCGQPALATYNAFLIVENLIRQGMSEEEAWDFYRFNIEGAWVGENTPIHLFPFREIAYEP